MKISTMLQSHMLDSISYGAESNSDDILRAYDMQDKLIERDRVLVQALKDILKECPLEYPTISSTIVYKSLMDIGEECDELR